MSDLKKRMEEIIQKEVTDAAFEFLRNKGQDNTNNAPSDYDHVKRSEDLDNSIFYGGDPSGISNPRYTKINENQENRPTVTSSEIAEFEKMFRENVSTNAIFNKREDGNIDFKLYNGDSGTEASISGSVPLQAEDRIDFTYSIQNGPHVSKIGRASCRERV